jgi:hypothetical protein
MSANVPISWLDDSRLLRFANQGTPVSSIMAKDMTPRVRASSTAATPLFWPRSAMHSVQSRAGRPSIS